MRTFDDLVLRSALRVLGELADRLDEASAQGRDARELLDLAEAKAVAAMAVHKRLVELGWTAPAPARVSG